jgi:hypothetical protein
MVASIKYSTKIFTEIDPAQKKKGKKTPRKVYIDAYDNIIAAMSGRRIFDRFGFNSLKKNPEPKQGHFLKQFKQWTYSPEVSDWVEVNGETTLTNYAPSPELAGLLKDSIIKSEFKKEGLL